MKIDLRGLPVTPVMAWWFGLVPKKEIVMETGVVGGFVVSRDLGENLDQMAQVVYGTAYRGLDEKRQEHVRKLWRERDKPMNTDNLLESLRVAKEIVDGWAVDEWGHVLVHPDAIRKALNAAWIAAGGAEGSEENG